LKQVINTDNSIISIAFRYLIIVLLLIITHLANAQRIIPPGENFRNNIVKINILPLGPMINGNNQKWLGLEYERFIDQQLSLSIVADAGLFEDYTYIKYHDYFDEHDGFSYTQLQSQTWGYHLKPSIKYYFLTTKSKKGQGLYLGGMLDFNQYFNRTEIYEYASHSTTQFNKSTTRFCAGTILGAQYIAFSRITIDLNISLVACLFTVNSGDDSEQIDPLNAIWVFNGNSGWSTVNFMIGYAFGGGKRK